jgi:hypothetical protein
VKWRFFDSDVLLRYTNLSEPTQGANSPVDLKSTPYFKTTMPNQWKQHAETMLAKKIQSYLPVHGHGDEYEQEQLRQVCSAMERLLDELLREEEMWNPHNWIDGVLGNIEIPSPGLLHLQGLAIWGDRGTRHQWWEPFSASVHVTEGKEELLRYEIMFADAAVGLGKVPYNAHPRGWNWAPPEKWLFVFTTG